MRCRNISRTVIYQHHEIQNLPRFTVAAPGVIRRVAKNHLSVGRKTTTLRCVINWTSRSDLKEKRGFDSLCPLHLISSTYGAVR